MSDVKPEVQPDTLQSAVPVEQLEPVSYRARIRVVILNYRTADLTVACLQSLVPEAESFPEFHVVVVDNQSSDGSVETIGEAIAQNGWSDWVTLMPLDHNGGYASGNNAAIRPALNLDQPPQYFHILNPDTVVQPGALKALVEFMEAQPEAGIAGSRLQDPDGTPQCSAFRFPNLLGEIEGGLRLGPVSKLLAGWRVVQPIPDTVSQTDWVAGASMIVRREVFETAGLMDDVYFLYYEEVDFCLAAQRVGWSCWYVPDSRVVHYVGSSTGVSDTTQARKRLPTYWFDSRRRYFVKNYGPWYAALSEIALAFSYAVWRIRRAIQQKPDLDPPHFLTDLLRNSTLVKGAALSNSPSAMPGSDANQANQPLGLWAQIKEDWEAHGRDWTLPGFRAVAVHRFGNWRMTLQPKLLRAPFSLLYQMLYRKVRNGYGIELPYTVQLGRRVIIEHQGAIVIHGYSIIGDDCILRQGVTLGNRTLDQPFDAPKLGQRVNVGAGAKLLGKIEIGDGAAIGANAVVLKDVPAGHVAVGIPAKLIDPKS